MNGKIAEKALDIADKCCKDASAARSNNAEISILLKGILKMMALQVVQNEEYICESAYIAFAKEDQDSDENVYVFNNKEAIDKFKDWYSEDYPDCTIWGVENVRIRSEFIGEEDAIKLL